MSKIILHKAILFNVVLLTSLSLLALDALELIVQESIASLWTTKQISWIFPSSSTKLKHFFMTEKLSTEFINFLIDFFSRLESA